MEKKNSYIEVRELEKQIDEILSQVEIPEAFVQWVVKYLNELHDSETEDQRYATINLDNAYKESVQRINNLVKLKISPQNTDASILSDDDFTNQMGILKSEKSRLEQQKKMLGERVDSWVELSIKTFDFACHARYWFENGTLKDKKQILATIGSNFLLKDKILYLDVPMSYQAIKDSKNEVDKITDRFEPQEKQVLTAQMAHLFEENSVLQRRKFSQKIVRLAHVLLRLHSSEPKRRDVKYPFL